MIVCHCNGVTDHDIRAAVAWMRAADPATIITPGRVLRALGQKADCGGCMPLFLDSMRTSPGLAVARCPDGAAVPVLKRAKDRGGA